MKRRFKWDKKYLYWGVTAFCVIACCILFYMALRYIPAIGKAIGGLFRILTPFVWGLVITYLLTPLMKSLERGAFKPLGNRLFKKKEKGAKKFARSCSVIIAELVLLVIIAALVYLIIPQLYSSIETIVINSNTYISNITGYAERLLEDFPEAEEYAMTMLGGLNDGLVGWLKNAVLPQLGSIVTNVTTGVYVVLKAIYNLIIGIIVSIYILSNLERFEAYVKRVLYCIFTVEAAEKICEGVRFTDKTFMGFISGKLLDSAIIGLICYIFCVALRMPYALLVSVIVGVTNVIPFFGPFIGAVPSALIILLVNPLKALIFVIFIIILQQLDGNVIGPKILGSSIGINGFWVMFSIILGAGLFGFWGMLLGVPVFAVIYALISRMVNKKLKRSGLPWEPAEYVNMDHIDPATYEIIRKPVVEKSAKKDKSADRDTDAEDDDFDI